MFYIDDKFKLIVEHTNSINSIFDYEDIEIGNIYNARVDNIIKSMNAAFVDIGKSENAYLSLKDCNKKIVEGENILVAVKKVPQENKAIRLTMEISISGRYIILFPEKNFLKSSSKLLKEDIEQLKELNLKGVLFRTEAKDVETNLILKEYNELVQISNRLINNSNLIKDPKLLSENNHILDYLYKNAGNEKIIVNNKDLYKKLKDEFNVEYDNNFSILYNPYLLYDYKNLFDKKVELKNGGNIVIEETESLISIDVNTSSFIGKNSFEDTIYKNNLIAAKEVARQVKLRNLSGIILVDFVDMKNKEHKKILKETLIEEFKKDNIKTVVYGYTRLNLMEISRQNNGAHLKNKINSVNK